MQRKDHERLSEVFLQVCELEGKAREAYLEQVCAGDLDLRREVEGLLEQDVAELPMDRIPTDEDRARAVFEDLRQSNPLPKQIGGYEVLGLLGEGGMGMVYRAKQSSPQREVALKVLRPGLELPELARRLEAESRLLAKLGHVGICLLYTSPSPRDRTRSRMPSSA